jgi:hypothetical protein
VGKYLLRVHPEIVPRVRGVHDHVHHIQIVGEHVLLIQINLIQIHLAETTGQRDSPERHGRLCNREKRERIYTSTYNIKFLLAKGGIFYLPIKKNV